MRFLPLVALVAGHKLAFTDWFESDQTEQITDKINLIQKDNNEILKTIDEKIEQAERNSAQGELGRTLAMNKINEMKLAMIQYKTNFLTEAKKATSDLVSEEDLPVVSLAQKKTYLSMLEKKVAEIKQRVPKVQQLETDLGLPEDVEDSELNDTVKSLEKAYNEARDSIKGEAVEQAKKEQ